MGRRGEGLWEGTRQVTTSIEVLRARAKAANGRPMSEDEFGNIGPRPQPLVGLGASDTFPAEEPEELFLGEEGAFDEQLADGFEILQQGV